MKNNILSILFILASINMHAQDQPEAIDPKVQEKIKSLHIAYISDKLSLTPAQAQKFWPVYNEFSDRRNELRKELITARRKVRTDEPDPEKNEALAELALSIRQRELDLENEYSAKFLQVISAQQILDLRKAERDFQQMIINQLQQRRATQRRENLRR